MFMFIALTSGCRKHDVDTDSKKINVMYSEEFAEICKHDEVYYLKHNDTGIMYIMYYGATSSSGSTYKAGITVLYNSNGIPMSYEEFQTIHTHNK